MGKSNGALGAIGKVITYILVVLLVLGIAGMVAYFALRAQGVTYYVEYNGERYIANGDGGSIALLNGKTYNFAVKSLTGEEVNYSVKVTSNGANNFLFTMNDEFWYLWNDDEAKDDYTDVFEVGKDTDGFTLTLPEGFTVEQAIEQKYGADIVLDQELQADLNYFMIVVTVENSIVRIPFRFSDLTVTLDPPQIVF